MPKKGNRQNLSEGRAGEEIEKKGKSLLEYADKMKKGETVELKLTKNQLTKYAAWYIESDGGSGVSTTYREEYCIDIIKFFKKKCDVPYTVVETVLKKKDGTPILNRAGDPIIDKTLIPNTPPYLIDFAIEIGVMVKTLRDWSIKHVDFGVALEHAKELRTKMLVDNGLIGLYNPQSWIFAAKNLSGMTDKTDITSGGESVFNVNLQRFGNPGEVIDVNPEEQKQIDTSQLR